MDIIQAAVLAFIQGVTEFLPVSSSGHLVLVPKLFGWPDQGLAFDVAVHLGSLVAVLVYFRTDLINMLRGLVVHLTGGPASPESCLAWSVIFATLPVGLAGFILNDWIEINLRSAVLVGFASLVFGAILWGVDRRSADEGNLNQINFKKVLIIGCAQVLALIPGVSRSGMTILAGRYAGLSRSNAARFSFLMSIPVILLASGLKSWQLFGSDAQIDWAILAFATVLSGLIAYACIHWFLGFIKRYSMVPFALYLMILGVIIISMFW